MSKTWKKSNKNRNKFFLKKKKGMVKKLTLNDFNKIIIEENADQNFIFDNHNLNNKSVNY